jgi:hypothetical protein
VIADIDEALRKLLLREIEIKGNDVDIQFHQPKREWSARLNKPTFNLFLFDLRENLRLRGSEQLRTVNFSDGTSELRRNPVRMDLRYMLTAWAKDPLDEHLLLASALVGLLRNPFLPEAFLPERSRNQPAPIPLEVATFIPEHGPVDKLSEIWGVLDNEIRPGILLTVIISMDPYQPQVYKQVRTREIRFVQDTAHDTANHLSTRKVLSKKYFVVGGSISSQKFAISTLSLVLVEKNEPIAISDDGRFSISKIAEGEYHLDIIFNQKVLKRQIIRVPSADYQIQV